MDTQVLTAIGLTPAQASAYLVLVQHGSMTPPELASKTKHTRTNAYKILDQLVAFGLARRTTDQHKVQYRVENPTALEAFAKKSRDSALTQEKRVRDAMPTLLSYFYTYAEQPGIRFFQGQEGIKQIFEDMLRTRQTIYLLRSPADVKFYDDVFFEKFKARRAKRGIETRALTPKVASAIHSEDIDKHNKFLRTWLPAHAYTANVEWDVYGNKVALISYGEEAIGTIIESPQIAESFRQIFSLMQLAAQGNTATE